MKKEARTREDRINGAAKAVEAEKNGNLSDEHAAVLFELLPRDAWSLIHTMFTNATTTFSAPAVRSAFKVQEFTRELIKHSSFTA
ncbi:hypothetical protein LCGC14_2265580 [marine sediment metagenome]|uniref:Uncharacterized protein n=1 Tax=marine sediment metagenome TaxID=412755 RepID=A0A0F9FTH8_9ZZZZ